MTRSRRTFSPEYKCESAKIVINTGRTIAEVARELGVREQVLGRWVKAEREAEGLGPTVIEPDFRAPPAAEPVPDPPLAGHPRLLGQFEESIAAAGGDVTATDKGLVAVGRAYALVLDAAFTAGFATAKDAAYLLANLKNVQVELTGSPQKRRTAAAGGQVAAPAKGKLHLLRESRGGQAGGRTG